MDDDILGGVILHRDRLCRCPYAKDVIVQLFAVMDDVDVLVSWEPKCSQ